MDKKKVILIFLGVLVILSVFSYFKFYKEENHTSVTNDIVDTTNSEGENNTNNISSDYESTDKTIQKPIDDLNNSEGEQCSIIFIKNIDFLANKDVTIRYLLLLKDNLNKELKSIDTNIYEVNLIEDTYKKTDKGFYIEAKADKLTDKTICITLNDGSYSFSYK